MTPRQLQTLTLSLLAIGVLLLFLGLCFRFFSPSSISISESPSTLRPPPQNRFEVSRPAYDKISSQLLKLNFLPPKMQLPDLQNKLTFLGTNARPDTDPETKPYFIGIANASDRISVKPAEKIYLKFDRMLNPARYVFSPGNALTPLWFEIEPQGESILIRVSMSDENGNLLKDPASLAKFTLPPTPGSRRAVRPANWEIGKYRVDATLLARQRARWYGRDLFIERHGGEEFASIAKKERLDFGEENAPYSVYIGLNDTLIWKEDRWVAAEPSSQTRAYPIMQLKKIEDRLLLLELWDLEGEQSVNINLLKSREPWNPKQYLKDFQFISSRTRTQYIFEIKGVRTVLRPHDWLLQKDGEWTKLNTSEEIDDYVNRKLTGVLFIFDGPSKGEEEEDVLKATLFNPSRSALETFSLTTAGNKSKPTPQPVKETEKQIENKPIIEGEVVLPPTMR